MKVSFNRHQYLDLDSKHLDVYTNPGESDDTIQKSFSYIKLDPDYKDTLLNRISQAVANFFRKLLGFSKLSPILVAMRDREQTEQKTRIIVWVKQDELKAAQKDVNCSDLEQDSILTREILSFSDEDLSSLDLKSYVSSETVSPPLSSPLASYSPQQPKKAVHFAERNTVARTQDVDLLLFSRLRTKVLKDVAELAEMLHEQGHFGADYYLRAKSSANLHKLFS